MSLGVSVLKSSFFLFASNWIKRTIGIVSLIVLARLLVPADYGIIAVATLIIKFMELMSETGIKQYLLSRKNLSDDMLDSAWTLRLVTRVFIALVIILVSPLASDYFELPELRAVLIVIAVVPLLDGLISPSIFILSRNLDYKNIALLNVCSKICAFLVTVSIAYQFRSYWALVAGDIIFSTVFLIGSYMMHNYRPAFTLRHWREQWAFSKWIYSAGLFGFARAKMDIFIASKAFGTHELGVYNFSKEIATLPEAQLSRPLNNVFITSISKSRSDLDHVAETLEKLMACQISLLLPAAAGLFTIAHILVPVVLGDNWINAIPVIKGLAALSISYALTTALKGALIALERVKNSFVLDVSTFFLILPMLFLAARESMEVFSYVRSLSGVMIFLAYFLFLTFIIPLKKASLLLSIFPSVIATIAMVLTTRVLDNSFGVGQTLPKLLGVLAGSGIVYLLFFLPASFLLSKCNSTSHIFIMKMLAVVLSKLKTVFMAKVLKR